MTKAQLHRHFRDHMANEGATLNLHQVAEFFDELERTAANELMENGEFTLPGVAKLTIKDQPERTGRNPATGETIRIAAKRVVKARIASQLQRSVLEDG